jgi:hypothetical protein
MAPLGGRHVDEFRFLHLPPSLKAQVPFSCSILPGLKPGSRVIALPGPTPTAQYIATKQHHRVWMVDQLKPLNYVGHVVRQL